MDCMRCVKLYGVFKVLMEGERNVKVILFWLSMFVPQK